LGAIQEEPHAQGLGALHGHQPSMPPDVVLVFELGEHCFVGSCVPLECGIALFDSLTETRANLKIVVSADFQVHARLLFQRLPLPFETYRVRCADRDAKNALLFFLNTLKVLCHKPILGQAKPRRQITPL
jgi:hypothetical protein